MKPAAPPCGCTALRRAARTVTRYYEQHLFGTGLNIAQFTLLQALADGTPLTQGQLARVLQLDSTTLSRTLRPLENRGWLRSHRAKDRREWRIELTAAGRARLERARAVWDRAQRLLQLRVGRERWRTLLAELSKLEAAARKGEGPRLI